MGSGLIHLANSCPHSESGTTGVLGSGVGRMRRWTEDSGTAVRTQVQDRAGTLEITLNGHRPERVEGGSGSDPKLTLAITVCPLTHHPPTHWSQTVTRAPDIGGTLTSIAAFTQSHSGRVPMPLGLLLMDPQELEMPSLVAQDHCWGGGNTDSRAFLGPEYQVQTELHSTEIHLAFPSWGSQASASL